MRLRPALLLLLGCTRPAGTAPAVGSADVGPAAAEDGGGAAERYGDLLWALLNGVEFRTIH